MNITKTKFITQYSTCKKQYKISESVEKLKAAFTDYDKVKYNRGKIVHERAFDVDYDVLSRDPINFFYIRY